MSNHAKGKLQSFIMGKGFYIALAICLVGAGTAAWVTVNSTMEQLQQDPFTEIPPAAQQPGGQQGATAQAEKTPPVQPQAKETEPVEQKKQEVKKEQSSSAKAPSESSSSASSSPESSTYEEAAVPSGYAAAQKKQQMPSFCWPIEAKVMAKFSGDTLVENITMKDWRTHNGIDLQAALGTEVRSASGGKVTAVKEDALWGTVVEVTDGEYTFFYSGLNDKVQVKVNDAVKAGQPLGILGEIPCEISLEPHLHFAVKRSGSYVDPLSILK